jgi:hypothetical protein
VMFTTFPENSFAMLFRTPDQPYYGDLEAVVIPDPLQSLTDVETEILPPNDDCVQWYAAYLCCIFLQQFGPASFFKKEYKDRTQDLTSTKGPVRTPNIYLNRLARVSRVY